MAWESFVYSAAFEHEYYTKIAASDKIFLFSSQVLPNSMARKKGIKIELYLLCAYLVS